MRRNLLVIAVLLMECCYNASAQNRIVNMETHLVTPVDSALLNLGPMAFEFYVENLGPDYIVPGDTLLYTYTGATAVYARVFQGSLGVYDTSRIAFNLNVTSAPSGPMNFCVRSILINGSSVTDDTSNNEDCHSIQFNTTNGLADLIFSEQQLVEQLYVFPNPATDLVHLNYEIKSNTEMIVVVTDITGRRVSTRNYGRRIAGERNFPLDLSSLGSGLYFIELTENSLKARGKVLIQR